MRTPISHFFHVPLEDIDRQAKERPGLVFRYKVVGADDDNSYYGHVICRTVGEHKKPTDKIMFYDPEDGMNHTIQYARTMLFANQWTHVPAVYSE